MGSVSRAGRAWVALPSVMRFRFRLNFRDSGFGVSATWTETLVKVTNFPARTSMV